MKVFRVKTPLLFTTFVIVYNILPIAICLLLMDQFSNGDLTLFLNIYYGLDILWIIVILRNKATLFSDHFVYYRWLKRDIVYLKDIASMQLKLIDDMNKKRECVVVLTKDNRKIEMPLKDNALFMRFVRGYIQNIRNAK